LKNSLEKSEEKVGEKNQENKVEIFQRRESEKLKNLTKNNFSYFSVCENNLVEIIFIGFLKSS
jgi:hypothetical protein